MAGPCSFKPSCFTMSLQLLEVDLHPLSSLICSLSFAHIKNIFFNDWHFSLKTAVEF